tara:strand:+ start:185 stop:490 length:306 start_codon:yes stop_codon:yes gene_type:complete
MHFTRLILEGGIKIKDYLIKIKSPVKTNNNARKYSVILFVFSLLINVLNPLPKRAHKLIDGKHITAAVIVTNATPIKIFSSVGKNPDATAIAIDHALGFMN